MIGMGASAFEWLAERLLQLRKDSKDRKRTQWNQVADYFEQIAAAIEAALAQYRAGSKPHGFYAQLLEMHNHFYEVASLVIKDKEALSQYQYQLSLAIPILQYDCYPLEVSFGEFIYGLALQKTEDPLIYLQTLAGQFRGLSVMLRAKA